MKTVNVGVIGVGAMGENHVRVYHKMEEAILLDVSDLPPVKNGKEGSKPTSDIIDAFSLCESLRLELKIKNGIESIDDQPKYIKEVFIPKTDEHPLGLINSDFIYK